VCGKLGADIGPDWQSAERAFSNHQNWRDTPMIEAAHTYHALYLAVHRARAAAPRIWTDHHCTRVLTSIMSAKPFS
jgi:hypothetical protein